MSGSWATAARQVPGLDHDPCPGDVAGVRGLADGLRRRGEALDGAARACRGWDPGAWTGPAADGARAAVDELGDRLGLLRRSLGDAGEVLRAWASTLEGLQAEAAALGEEALENRRRRLAATVRVVAATTTGGDLVPGDRVLGDRDALVALEAGRRQVQERAEELHARWAAAGRRASAALDGTALARGGPSWRGARDQAHDALQAHARRHARVTAWASDALGAASAVAGVVALVPAAAPVAVPVSLGLGLASVQLDAQLALGADGSTGGLVLGAATLGAGAAAGGLLRAASAAGAGASRTGLVVGHGVERTAVAVDAGQVVRPALVADGAVRPRTLEGLDAVPVPVTVHDVDEPWQVGHGLSGSGFAGVATVPVATPPPGGPVVAPPVRTPTPLPPRRTTHVAPPRPVGGTGRRDG